MNSLYVIGIMLCTATLSYPMQDAIIFKVPAPRTSSKRKIHAQQYARQIHKYRNNTETLWKPYSPQPEQMQAAHTLYEFIHIHSQPRSPKKRVHSPRKKVIDRIPEILEHKLRSHKKAAVCMQTES